MQIQFFSLKISAILMLLIPFNKAKSQDQDISLWGKLKPGAYQVGFEEINVYDYSRTFPVAPNQNFSARPMQISLWYPASNIVVSPKMKFKTYLEKTSRIINFDSLTTIEDTTHYFYKWFGRNGAKLKDLEKLMYCEVNAIENASPAKGKHPLLIFAQGFGRPAYSAFVLCEYLASHGYVVASMQHIGYHSRRPKEKSSIVLDTQVGDIAFVRSYLQDRYFIDTHQLGLITFSSGATAAVAYQAKNRDVKGMALLGGMRRVTAPVLESFPYYADSLIQRPILFCRENHAKKMNLEQARQDTAFHQVLPFAPKYQLRFMELNHPGLLSFAMIESILVPKFTRFLPIGDTQASHEYLCQSVRQFFQAIFQNQPPQFELPRHPIIIHSFVPSKD